MDIGVYGLGRFGAFWAGLLAKEQPVMGYSRTPSRQAPEGVRRVDEDEVLRCDVLFLAVAISSMEEVLERIGARLRPTTLVLDTCSVKVYPVKLMERLLPPEVRIIGTHPMFGPDSGRNGVSGLPLVYCPVRVDEETGAAWKRRFEAMGLAVTELSPDEHDREAAYTQGVAHFVGRVLEDLRLKPSAIATVGYAKLLEIIEQTCNDPWQLFLDLQRYNPYTADMRASLYASLAKIKEQLETTLDGTRLDSGPLDTLRGRSIG